jgi:hypothetical protein
MTATRTSTALRLLAACGIPALLVIVACVQTMPSSPHDWWSGHGPVVNHANFPGKCSLCHTTKSWQELRPDFQYDHALETGVELLGAHQDAQCLRCHNDRGPVENFAARGCAGCHEDVHMGRMGEDCAQCHDEQSWQAQGQLAEHASTRFPLFGIHAAVSCDRCHAGIGSGIMDPLSPNCVNCHSDDLARADNPNHAAQGWVDDCQQCHQPTIWSGAGFRHSGFPLTGAHAAAQCEACHAGGVYAGTPSQCSDCHLDAYQSTSDPDHLAFNFPLACDSCHTTSAWLPADFRHTGITSGCVDCHLSDYQGATDPNHVASNLPMSCEDCHSTKRWRPTTFNHAGITSGCVDCHLTDYQGAKDPDHVANNLAMTCEDCHTTNAWIPGGFNHAGISNGCVNCHLDEYQSTTDPDHDALGFPLDCEFCHNTNTWDGANFDHNFPIDSGAHRRLDCADCHTTPGSSVFSCTHCHEHRKSEADKEHKDVKNGYVWSTPACYACHPDGRADD